MIDNKVIMFAGKGGVGKTTCAAATGLYYASIGQPTIVISTDPTPSLRHIFEMHTASKPTRVDDRLYIHEIGEQQVKQMWDSKFGREVYEVFSSFVDIGYQDFVDFVSSILPGLRDEFMVDYIREMAAGTNFQKIIWDTAPLGQTLGLLKMPTMLGAHLKTAPRIYSRLKTGRESRKSVLDIIKGWEALSGRDLEFLKTAVCFNIVTIPESLAVEQLDDVFQEFEQHELTIRQLIVNNVIFEADSVFLRTKSLQQKSYLDLLQKKYQSVDIIKLPMFPHEIKGIAKLNEIKARLFPERNS